MKSTSVAFAAASLGVAIAFDEAQKAFEKKLDEDCRRQEREEMRMFRLNGDMGRKGKGERKRTRGDWSSIHGRQGRR